MPGLRSFASIFLSAVAPLVLLSGCSTRSDSDNAREGQATGIETQVAPEAQESSDTVAASESCVDIGKPNPTGEDVAKAYTESLNEDLVARGLPTGDALPGSGISDFDEFALSVPEGGFSKFASAVCNKPLNPNDKTPGHPDQDMRGGLVLSTIGICEGLKNSTWDSVEELKVSQTSMFAESDPTTVPEGDPTGTTYGQYIENNLNYLQSAIDYVCPQYK